MTTAHSVNPAISVIVPVFNAEDYLPRCVESIRAQSFGDFELILVDDGSSDGSPRLCDDAASGDPRVRVIHRGENGGVSYARRSGLAEAKGDYVIFCDNDDWIEENSLEKLHRTALSGDYDVVVSDYFMEVEDEKVYVEQEIHYSEDENGSYIDEGNLDRIILIKHILAWGDFQPVTWNKLVRRRIYDSLEIWPKITYSEDRVISVQVLYFAEKIGRVPAALYHWCLRDGSGSRSGAREKRLKNLFEYYVSAVCLLRFLREKEGDRYGEFRSCVDSSGDVVLERFTFWTGLEEGTCPIHGAYRNALERVGALIGENPPNVQERLDAEAAELAAILEQSPAKEERR